MLKMALVRKLIEGLRGMPALLGFALAAELAIPIIMFGVGLANQNLANEYLLTEKDIFRLS